MLWTALLGRNAESRYLARFSLLDRIAKRLGFRLYNRNLYWLLDRDMMDVWRQFAPHAPHITDRKYILFSMACATSHLPGDTAECGVFDGGSSFLMCVANADKSGDFRHHVFDSFEGLSAPDVVDYPDDVTAYKWHKHDLSVPLSQVQANLNRFSFVEYYKGWIPDRFEEVAGRSFSFVHIDVDLYQPTYDSIAFFYERLVPGGILLCDDYGSTICPGAKKAFDEFIADKPEKSVIHLTTGQGFIIKQA